LKGAEG